MVTAKRRGEPTLPTTSVLQQKLCRDPQVKSGKVVAKRDIERCDGNEVYFTDGSAVRADVIVACSGYKSVSHSSSRGSAHDEPAGMLQIYICGRTRRWRSWDLSARSSVRFRRSRSCSRATPRWCSAGQRALPSPRNASALPGRTPLSGITVSASRRGGCGDWWIMPYYNDQIARLIGCRPRFWKLLFTAPRKWWWAVSTPWNGCQFWLNDESASRAHLRDLRALSLQSGQRGLYPAGAGADLAVCRADSRIRLFVNERFVWREESTPRGAACRRGRPAERAA